MSLNIFFNQFLLSFDVFIMLFIKSLLILFSFNKLLRFLRSLSILPPEIPRPGLTYALGPILLSNLTASNIYL